MSAERPVADSDTACVLTVACGSSHSCALLDCDVVATWGRGEDGQLGHGDAQDRPSPKAVAALIGANTSSLVCGAEYTVAICANGAEVYSWGWGDFGRLGHGDCGDIFIPKRIAALAGKTVIQVACGDTHTLVVTQEGQLYSFGRNQNGQLGLGMTDDCSTPTLVEALQNKHITSAACGAEHSLVASASGEVYSWGWGRYGNLGNGECRDRWEPTLVASPAGAEVNSVACGWRHSIILMTNGEVWTFGWNRYGQLGHGDHSDRLTPAKVLALAGKNITQSAGGWRHTVAISDDGSVYTWGWNKFGQLGLGTRRDVNAPTLATKFGNERLRYVACGWRHTMAITESGLVYSWGRGVNGQLGHGNHDDALEPRALLSLSKGHVNKHELIKTAGPSGDYVPLTDRYAVVPDQQDHVLSGGSLVPDVPDEPPPGKKPCP